jgi:TetR/AcrR family transcriptional regulator, ethionamide resistance regulator
VASRTGSESAGEAGTRALTQVAVEDRVKATVEAAALSHRPRRNDRSTAVERDIFAATERLLAQHNARDVSVAHILEEAGISRATFYHYFSSKWEVVNYLAASVMTEIYDRVGQFAAGGDEISRQEALQRSIIEGCQIWATHRAVLRAIVDHWREVPELRAMLVAVLEPFRRAIAEELERERASGIAPQGPDSERLVAALLWSSLSCLHIAGLSDVDDIPDEESAAQLLTAIWMRTLYGHADVG